MAASIQVIAPTTGAVSESSATMFDASRYESIIVGANALAGAEEVDIFAEVNGTLKPANDASGTARKLTATVTFLELSGGLAYAFAKDATTAACGVFVTPGSAKQR